MGLGLKNMPGTCCNRNCRSLQLVYNIYVWIFFFMVSHISNMTIIQCMIMTCVDHWTSPNPAARNCIHIVPILPQHWPKVNDASLCTATCDDDVLAKSS